ncbi:TetR/AcrR family transcriptional regulator [Mycolicibacterium sp. ELW1]|jgi:TetR/AcrR family transcriptional repressor of nem operon|uniref:TetR/AcrR family transcriptional regulator n=1 Tax=Mycobacteriaceae TaxID=1762 RepID=UPI0011EC1811|nr:TetR/AcrR family transcriptional regulator [Mycobacterium sp. ELW1]QEN12639.1 TetR/AcrR family transcriptional regulator [Mycobacterium sp. ELW1]
MTTQQEAALSHKERLFRAGAKLFYENGFHGTTIDAVLAEAGVPKGSFYHHFGSKDAFGQAVLSRYMGSQGELVATWAARTDLSTAEKVTGYYRDMSQVFVKSGFQTACLTGKFSTEVAATSDVFRPQLAGQIDGWKARLSTLFAAGQKKGDVRQDRPAEDLADVVLALIQGSFVLTLSTRDEHTLATVCDTIRQLIEPPN